MKKASIFILSILFLSFQSKSIEDDVTFLCSGKWYIEGMKVSGKEVPLPPEMIKNSWVTYHADGKVEGVDQEGKLNKGKWEYLKETRTVKSISDKDEISLQKIVSISDSKLVFSMTNHGYETILILTKR